MQVRCRICNVRFETSQNLDLCGKCYEMQKLISGIITIKNAQRRIKNDKNNKN